jgi:hypothetical protein
LRYLNAKNDNFVAKWHKKTPAPEADAGVPLLNPHNFDAKLLNFFIVATDFVINFIARDLQC